MQDGLTSGTPADTDARAPNGLAAQGVTYYEPSEHAPSEDNRAMSIRRRVNNFVDGVRRASPDWFVNSGSQVNFGMRAAADGFSVWSAIREGSASPARLVASGITLFTELLGIRYKDAPLTHEDRETYKHMTVHDYFWLKTKQAFDPKHHVGETYGMGAMANGLFTMLSGIMQSAIKHPTKRQLSWEIAQGALTTFAGACMTYVPSREKAWQTSSLIFTARMPITAMQAHTAYYRGYPIAGVREGDWQQAAKLVLNTLSGIHGFFFGGIRKLPDGTIVRVTKPEEPAKQPVMAPAADTAAGPATRVSQVSMDAAPDKAQQNGLS